MSSIGRRAEQALARVHREHGQVFDLYKYRRSATSSIYNQRRKTYEPPIEIRGHISRLPVEEVISKSGDSSSIDVEVTIPVSMIKELFPTVEYQDAITTSDLIGFDHRRWRITQVSFTARIDEEPLLAYIKAREILGKKSEVQL